MMAIVEDASVESGISAGLSSSSSMDSSVSTSSNDQDHSSTSNNHDARLLMEKSISIQPRYTKVQVQSQPNSNPLKNLPYHQRSNGGVMTELQQLFSKLNPMAEEFVPHNDNHNQHHLGLLNGLNVGLYAQSNNTNNDSSFMLTNGFRIEHHPALKKKNHQGKRRMNSRTTVAQREEIIRRTVYVSDIDQQVTEEQLAALFIGCGQVVDCRICGDPNSVLRFAFIEFTDEEGARAALNLAGTVLGYYPVRVLPSKTAIAPVNPTFLPRTEDEREMCTRTIYCTNIDKKVTQADIKLFFQSVCGEVYRMRLLGDYQHSTRIAFVEFVMAESAINALNCSGVVLGSLPIRVSPSKTPVRPRAPRLMH